MAPLRGVRGQRARAVHARVHARSRRRRARAHRLRRCDSFLTLLSSLSPAALPCCCARSSLPAAQLVLTHTPPPSPRVSRVPTGTIDSARLSHRRLHRRGGATGVGAGQAAAVHGSVRPGRTRVPGGRRRWRPAGGSLSGLPTAPAPRPVMKIDICAVGCAGCVYVWLSSLSLLGARRSRRRGTGGGRFMCGCARPRGVR